MLPLPKPCPWPLPTRRGLNRRMLLAQAQGQTPKVAPPPPNWALRVQRLQKPSSGQQPFCFHADRPAVPTRGETPTHCERWFSCRSVRCVHRKARHPRVDIPSPARPCLSKGLLKHRQTALPTTSAHVPFRLCAARGRPSIRKSSACPTFWPILGPSRRAYKDSGARQSGHPQLGQIALFFTPDGIQSITPGPATVQAVSCPAASRRAEHLRLQSKRSVLCLAKQQDKP